MPSQQPIMGSVHIAQEPPHLLSERPPPFAHVEPAMPSLLGIHEPHRRADVIGVLLGHVVDVTLLWKRLIVNEWVVPRVDGHVGGADEGQVRLGRRFHVVVLLVSKAEDGGDEVAIELADGLGLADAIEVERPREPLMVSLGLHFEGAKKIPSVDQTREARGVDLGLGCQWIERHAGHRGAPDAFDRIGLLSHGTKPLGDHVAAKREASEKQWPRGSDVTEPLDEELQILREAHIVCADRSRQLAGARSEVDQTNVEVPRVEGTGHLETERAPRVAFQAMQHQHKRVAGRRLLDTPLRHTAVQLMGTVTIPVVEVHVDEIAVRRVHTRPNKVVDEGPLAVPTEQPGADGF
mmetsp:Transcript_22054/g.62873  ORF Transcript_22054/g.62873 Transcript_22054/m.62873 type:complete len:350 (+) Transcript_22054:185-1234(+)